MPHLGVEVSIRADASEPLEAHKVPPGILGAISFQFALMRVSPSRLLPEAQYVVSDEVSIRADASEPLEEPPQNIASDQHLRHPFTRHPKN